MNRHNSTYEPKGPSTMTHAAPVDFTDHASSPDAFDASGLRAVQRQFIDSAINTLPSPELRAFTQHLLSGHTPHSAARHMGLPYVAGERMWLEVQPLLAAQLGDALQ